MIFHNLVSIAQILCSLHFLHRALREAQAFANVETDILPLARMIKKCSEHFCGEFYFHEQGLKNNLHRNQRLLEEELEITPDRVQDHFTCIAHWLHEIEKSTVELCQELKAITDTCRDIDLTSLHAKCVSSLK